MMTEYKMHIVHCSIALMLIAGPALGTGCGGEDVPEDESQNESQEEPKTELDGELTIDTEPPEEVTAGESFAVAVGLVDQDDDPVEREGVEVTGTLNRNQFADGDETATAETDDSGSAEFDLRIEAMDTGLTLAFEADDEDFEDASVNSSVFDVIAAEASGQTSSITGEGGVLADGEETAEITITLLDEFDNPVVGVTPEFAASGDGNDYQECTETDDDGIATCSMSSTSGGEKTLEITDPVEVTGETIEFLRTCNEETAPFGGGDGSSEDPHRLCTPDHLSAVGDGTSSLGNDFILLDDIDLIQVSEFNVIGDEDDPFVGSFDGNDYTIENLTIDDTSAENVGLFGYIGEDAEVTNVAIEDVDVSGYTNVGGLAGTSAGTVTDSYVTGEISGEDSSVGGLMGRNADDGVITDSHADVDASGDWWVGGLTGLSRDDSLIADSYATGDVNGEGESCGGLVGLARYATITDSYATGDVEADDGAGGLIGHSLETELSGSYATGDAEVDELWAGGLVARNNEATITESYATGSATGDNFVGGLVGPNSGTITDSYATGEVTGDDEYVGGLVGRVIVDGTVDNSYWDEETSQISEGLGEDDDDDGVTGRTTDEFGQEDNFEDWDFDDIWTIGVAPDGNDRPILQWQE